MHKLTLLLIPLILLSSCTIDWNDEKDKRIILLANYIQELEKQDMKNRAFISELQIRYRDAVFSGNLMEIANAECQGELKKLKGE